MTSDKFAIHLSNCRDKSGQSHKKIMPEDDEDVIWYSCELCDYKSLFTRPLSKHKASKHNVDYNFRCYECDAFFASKSGLDKHNKRHNISTVVKSDSTLVVSNYESVLSWMHWMHSLLNFK